MEDLEMDLDMEVWARWEWAKGKEDTPDPCPGVLLVWISGKGYEILLYAYIVKEPNLTHFIDTYLNMFCLWLENYLVEFEKWMIMILDKNKENKDMSS